MKEKNTKGKSNIDKGNGQETQIIRFLFIHKLLERFIQGKSTEKEEQLVSGWKPSDEEGPLHMPDVDEEEIEARIYRKVSLHFSKEQRSAAKRKHFITQSLFRKWAVAASILLVVGSGIYIANKTREDYSHTASVSTTIIQTMNGEKKQAILPDGTTIHLNSNSRLSYISTEFNKEKREVILEEGEIFFDVARNEKKPFIIHNGSIATTVRGTSFNIKAYAMLEDIVISVRTGIVDVATENRTLERLTVNRQIIIHKDSKEYTSHKIDWNNAIGWMDIRLVLYDADIDELKLRLEQQFNIQIQINQDALKGVRFTASFEAEATLKDVMAVLHALYGANYKITGQTMTINK